jgi:MFS family permease
MRSATDADRTRSPAANRAGTGHERSLSSAEKSAVLLLGVPTLALALAVTVVTTYLPVVAQAFVGSMLVIGVIIGIEGLLALWLPLVAGAWSDRLRTRIGGRLPFLVAATPVMVAGLVALGFVSSVAALAVAALVFFAGYFLAYEPYRALYPDAVGDDAAGRAQGSQALSRGAGTGLALVGGGLLLGLGRAVPFLAAAAIAVVAMSVFVFVLVRRDVPDRNARLQGSAGVRDAVRDVAGLVRTHPELKAFLAANALWELSLAALKTFVVLYVTKGLGYSRPVAALIIGGVAVIVLIAAATSGKLADRYGQLRVMRAGLPLYGLGLLVPFLFTAPVVVAIAVPCIAVGGGVIMALPYAMLMRLMPEEAHGSLTGYYSFSRGLGTWLGPLLGGIAVTALDGPFAVTQGLQAVWASARRRSCSASCRRAGCPSERSARDVGDQQHDRGDDRGHAGDDDKDAAQVARGVEQGRTGMLEITVRCVRVHVGSPPGLPSSAASASRAMGVDAHRAGPRPPIRWSAP